MGQNLREAGVLPRLGVRSAIVSLVALLCIPLVACTSRSEKPAPTKSATAANAQSSVAAENAHQGTQNWRITNPALAGEIAGYAGATSYNKGETVDLHISTRADGAAYSLELYRMGWYGGTGGRLLKRIQSLSGKAQGYWSPGEGLRGCGRCQLDPVTGLLDANWPTSYKLKLDDSWPSGAYVVKLEGDAGKQAYVQFVVRDDSRRADLLLQLSVNTWQAYNAWGDRSLYGSFNDRRAWMSNQPRARKVSFNRPYDPMESGLPGYGAGEFFFWEYDFVRWAESQGYDMTYASDVDLHARKGLLSHRKGFVSIGHDEYWSWQQRDQVETGRDTGVGIAFFGGNDVYWQVRFEPDNRGVANRTLVCYKDAASDPAARSDPKRATVLWGHDPVDRPEIALTGTTSGSVATPPRQAWVVSDVSSWVFAGSGFKRGDSVPGIVGYEYDKLGNPAAEPRGLQVVAQSPVTASGVRDHAASVLYIAASGAPVFNAGTIQWSWGLDDTGHEKIGLFSDSRLQVVTKNVLSALITGIPAR